jgi:hypothetical protein
LNDDVIDFVLIADFPDVVLFGTDSPFVESHLSMGQIPIVSMMLFYSEHDHATFWILESSSPRLIRHRDVLGVSAFDHALA